MIDDQISIRIDDVCFGLFLSVRRYWTSNGFTRSFIRDPCAVVRILSIFTGSNIQLFRRHGIVILCFDHRVFIIITQRFIDDLLGLFYFSDPAKMAKIRIDRLRDHLHGLHIIALVPCQSMLLTILRHILCGPRSIISSIYCPLFCRKCICLFEIAGLVVFQMQVGHGAFICIMRFRDQLAVLKGGVNSILPIATSGYPLAVAGVRHVSQLDRRFRKRRKIRDAVLVLDTGNAARLQDLFCGIALRGADRLPALICPSVGVNGRGVPYTIGI